MSYEIEDRRKKLPSFYGSGQFVVFEVRSEPFPHRSPVCLCPTLAEARAKVKELKRPTRSLEGAHNPDTCPCPICKAIRRTI